MVKDSLHALFERDLNKLIEEINLFINEGDLWIAPGSVSNSAGNLCLHICGNLKHFIGATLGSTGYIRAREKEFALRNVPTIELIKNINETSEVVLETIIGLEENKLSKKYPINVFDSEMTVEFFLIHLHSHLNYHLGQINYLRRILID